MERLFDNIETIYQSRNTIVIRAVRLADQLPVILKTDTRFSSFERKKRLQNEYQLMQQAHIGHIEKPLEIIEHNHRTIMIFADSKLEALAGLIPEHGFNLKHFFTLAIEIATALDELHGCQVVHNDINPDNILTLPESNVIKVIDFDAASWLTEELVGFMPLSDLQGTLAYASPEQTGRINKPVDQRSDLYSVGITFYQLLTGKRPFATSQPGKLIYSHIAKVPPPVSDIRADIPEAVSKLVQKLIRKSPDKRYQTAKGLLKDLLYLQANLDKPDGCQGFIPGKHEQFSKISLSGKLYGRNQEIADLMACFEVCHISGQLVTVAGSAGIGKTALIRELYSPITRKKGFFLTGKFDQFSKGLAYTAIAEALKCFVRQVMGLEKEVVRMWQNLIKESLGEFGGVLTDIVPEFEKLIGRQAKLSPISPAETVRRRNAVFSKLINDLCQAGFPIVIFLDDMQWGNTSSFSLLKEIIELNSKNLFIILAYRDNEVVPTHPIKPFLDETTSQDLVNKVIHLHELNESNLEEWLNDLLPEADDHIDSLANCLFGKTEGNPFYITSMLHLVIEKQYLKRLEDGSIGIDLESISNMPADADIIDHLIRHINSLNKADREFLMTVSVLGNKFTQSLLAMLFGEEENAWKASVQALVKAHLIIKSGDTIMFAHDRIQQVAHELFDDEKSCELHLKVGQKIRQFLMASNTAQEKIDQYIHHFNIAAHLITEREQQMELAGLNILQGKHLKSNAAYQEAEQFFAKAVSLLPPQPFDVDYHMAIELFTEYGETLFLNLNYELGQHQFDLVIAHATSPLDCAAAYVKQINHYGANHQPQKSLNIALTALGNLGIQLPHNVKTEDGIANFLKIGELLKDRQPDDILNFPVTEEQLVLAQMDILAASVAPAFMSNPICLPGIIYQMLNISAIKGNCRLSPYGYIVYALLLCSMDQAEKGDAFGQVALQLMEKLDARKLFTKIPYVFATFVHHWKAPMMDSVQYLKQAINNGLETGDYEFASFAVSTLANVYFYSGTNIETLINEYDKYYPILNGFGKDFAIYEAKYWHQLLITMSDPDGDGVTVSGDVIDEVWLVQTLEEQQVLTTLCRCMVSKLFLAYLAGDYRTAMAVREKALDLLKAMTADVLNTICHFFSALTCIACYRENSQDSSLLEDAEQSLRKLKKWGEDAPDNYLCKAQLVEAEMLAVKGEQLEALRLYEKAIDTAHQTGNCLDHGVACECMGRYLLRVDLQAYGLQRISQSVNTFGNWGALNKAKRLSREFADSLVSTEAVLPALTHKRSAKALQTTLDLETLTRTIKSLTGNLEFNSLLEALLDAVMESSGATRVVYLHVDQGQLVVKAEKHANAETRIFANEYYLLSSFDLPVDLIETCYHGGGLHVLENIELQDSPQAEVQDSGSFKSALVIPLLRGTVVNGLVYLENELLADAFLESQVQFLSLLAGQAAIAIENAMIFNKLQVSEEKYRNLIESTCDIIWEMDADGVYTYVSPQVMSILGYRQEQFIGKAFSDFMPPREAKRVEKIFRKLLNEKQPIKTVENINLHCDGHEVIFETSGVPILDAAGTVLGYRGIGRDITKRKQAEEQLQQSRKMDAIGQLAGGVAHDFNNMLTGIMGAARLLEKRVDNEDERSASFIEMIMSSSTRAADLTNKLLTFGRKGKKESKAVDLHGVVEETTAILKRTLDKKIEIIVESEAEKFTVIGDNSQLQSALLNLCINASHAMPDGGKLSLISKNIMLDQLACDDSTFQMTPGQYIEIEVRDTGCGIEKENLKNIFEPFFTTKKQGQGTGLGLAAVYGTVCDHGGEITVTSVMAEGTSFYLRLPCSETVRNHNNHDTSVITGSGLILFVDDEATIRMTAESMLKSLGYRVLSAADGQEGVEMYKKHCHDIDLVVLDMMMPVMNGQEALLRIKEIDPDCKIIVTSGFIKKEILEELKKHGVHRFLRKPFQDFDLSQLIAAELKKSN